MKMTNPAYRTIERLILVLSPLTSILVSPYSNYDPINLVKIMVVSSIAFSIVNIYLVNRKTLRIQKSKSLIYIIIGLLLTLLSAFFFSGASLSSQFWGTFGRNTGLLTYVSLIIICYVIANVANETLMQKVLNSMIITSIPVTIYCLLQIAQLDPVPWSLHQTFATFGNINFLSAFIGCTTIALFNLLLNSDIDFKKRAGWCLLMLIQLSIVISTGSIQGIMMFFAGSGISFFLQSRAKGGSFYRYLKWPMISTALASFITVTLGLFNKGILAEILYQPSVIYRGDYMHAGWKMTLDHPIFGVGIDQYGDWYRSARGLISTTRNSPDRTADTAHNIFLDLSSGGGFPLITFYLCLVLFTFYITIKRLKNGTKIDSVLITVFAIWISYQLQSIISINQIAVGIWGWVYTGLLLSLVSSRWDTPKNNVEKNQSIRKINTRKVLIRKTNSEATIIFGSLGLILGFFLAFVPFKADLDFKSALESRDLNRMIKSTDLIGSTPFHLTQVINAAANGGFFDQARDLTLKLVIKDPRDFYGWKMLYSLPNSSQEERNRAIRTMIKLDPFNPTIPKN